MDFEIFVQRYIALYIYIFVYPNYSVKSELIPEKHFVKVNFAVYVKRTIQIYSIYIQGELPSNYCSARQSYH